MGNIATALAENDWTSVFQHVSTEQIESWSATLAAECKRRDDQFAEELKEMKFPYPGCFDGGSQIHVWSLDDLKVDDKILIVGPTTSGKSTLKRFLATKGITDVTERELLGGKVCYLKEIDYIMVTGMPWQLQQQVHLRDLIPLDMKTHEAWLDHMASIVPKGKGGFIVIRNSSSVTIDNAEATNSSSTDAKHESKE